MRIRLSIAIVVAALLVVASVTLASANSGSEADDNGGRVIKLFTVIDQDAFIDVDKSGAAPTLGDQIVFSDKVSEEKDGRVIGTDGGVCSIVNVDTKANSATAQCAATLSLPGGQIAAQGLLTFPLTDEPPPPFDLPITGGTGDFEGASGHLNVEETSATESILTVHLLG